MQAEKNIIKEEKEKEEENKKRCQPTNNNNFCLRKTIFQNCHSFDIQQAKINHETFSCNVIRQIVLRYVFLHRENTTHCMMSVIYDAIYKATVCLSKYLRHSTRLLAFPAAPMNLRLRRGDRTINIHVFPRVINIHIFPEHP